MFNEIRKSYHLIAEFVRTDFKLRYQDSFLGYIWSVIRPAMMFAILYFVFAYFFKLGKDVPHFASYLFLGVVFWSFFTEATSTSLTSIVERGELIRKTNFPKIVIVVSRVFAAAINLLINSVVVTLFILLGSGADVNWGVLFLPILMLELLVFTFSVSLVLSSLYVRFRDLGQIWEVMMQMLYYLTPVLYPLNIVLKLGHGETIAKIFMLNPLAQIIQDIRYVAITPETITYHNLFTWPYWRIVPIIIIILMLFVGIKVFKKSEADFAEHI